MAEKTPTQILEDEHRFIEKIVNAMPVLVKALEAGQKMDVEMLREIVEFMQTFADRCHHGKEENLLFPILGAKGVPLDGCPIGALTREHKQGRALVAELTTGIEAYAKGDPAASEALVKTLGGLINLYPNHIWKEDYLLFPMTNKVLSADEQQELLVKFAAVEAEVGQDVHARFEQLAQTLSALAQTAPKVH